MDFIDALHVLLRQWKIILIGAVAVIAAGVGAIVAVPTNYQATGQLVLLLPAQSTGTAAPTNPYLNLAPGLTVTASLIASTLSTKDAQRAVAQAGFTSEYAVGLNPGAGPVLEISAEDTDPAMAVRTRDEVIARLQAELSRIQQEEGAPARQTIRGRTNSAPGVADSLPGSKIRVLAALGGVGVVLTCIIAFITDRRRMPLVVSRPFEFTDRIEVQPPKVPTPPRPAEPSAPAGPHKNGSGKVAATAGPVKWWDA